MIKEPAWKYILRWMENMDTPLTKRTIMRETSFADTTINRALIKIQAIDPRLRIVKIPTSNPSAPANGYYLAKITKQLWLENLEKKPHEGVLPTGPPTLNEEEPHE